MKRKIILSIFLAAVFFMPFCYSQEIKNFDEFKEAMLLANKTWNEIKPQAETKEFYQRVFTRKIIEDIDNLRSVPQFYENTAVSTVVARFDSLRSFSNIELAALLQDSLSISNIMQWLEYNKIPWHRLNKKPFNSGIFSSVFRDYREGVRKDIDDEKSALNTRSVLLPLTAHSGVDLDGTVQWSQNPLPVISDRPSCPLAVLFEAVGLYDKAWRVQLEENEVRYYNFDHPNKRYCSFYVSAANTAYLSGNKKLGWSFLMNAAVFEDEKSFDLAMETAKLWFDVEAGKKELPEQKILMGDERKNVFLDIVKCYQEAMNAHPRAWLFIQEYKNEFDDADGLIKKIQDDWLNNIKMIHSVGFINEIVMYGVELYPAKNDPLSVTIPWPFPDGSVEKVKKKIRELADKITEDEKDGLIKWYFEDGKLAVKAKYISCNDNEVIVERENGEKEKLEIAKLFDGNKNYIYRRLAIRNIMVEDFCTLFHDWITSTNLLVQIDAKYLSLDEDNIITLELKDGKKDRLYLSELNETEQEYVKIWENWDTKKRAEAAKKLEEQKRQLVELRKKLLSEVQFRDWQSRDEIFRTKAKYISYDFKQKSVTIEQENGKQLTIELKDLCDTDRQYLRNLLNPKLPETKNK